MREERCRERGRRRVGGKNERGKHSQSYRNAGNNIKRLNKLLTTTVQARCSYCELKEGVYCKSSSPNILKMANGSG